MSITADGRGKIRRTETAQALSQTVRRDVIRDLPDAADRGFWDGLPEEVRKALIERGEAALAEEIPAIALSDYTEFSRNGNRVHFEAKYFRRRTALTQTVLAECAEHSGRFLPRILDLIWAILEETTWCLPAHLSYERDAAVLPVPDPERPVIDLFAAETAAILGVAEYLLREVFREQEETEGKTGSGTSVCRRIDAEIRRRILTPYLSTWFWWMGDGEQLLCNWTSWITQNVLLAVFTRRDGVFTDEEQERTLRQAAESVDYYLDDYNDDGSCSEGIFYYGHSALCLFGCLDVMSRVTKGGMDVIWKSEKIRRIAAYPVTMYIGGGQYFNYSDASPYAGHRGARDYLFAKATGNEAYETFVLADFGTQELTERLLPDEESLYCHLLQLMHYREMASGPLRQVLPADAYYEEAGLLSARDTHWALAAKAGHNGDIHNHNDVGSVTLYLDARPFLIDLGVGTYTAKTFSADRYEIWTMQSAYHNTVNFIDESGSWIMQHDGREYAAGDARCGITADSAELSMDLARAYGDTRIRRCLREVRLIRGTTDAAGYVLIGDTFVTDPGIRPVLTFLTYEKPEILRDEDAEDPSGRGIDREGLRQYGNVIRIRIGDLGALSAAGTEEAVIETCPIEDERLGIAWKHACYRIVLKVSGDRSRVLLTGAETVK